MLPETLLFAPAGSIGPALAAALLGLLIGSFLNVVIYRIPKMMQRESDNYVAHESGKELPHTDRFNLMVPRSACPHCGHQITAMENIPVISWLALRGKCRACKAPISPRYPAIELLTGILSALMVWTFGSGAMGLSPDGVAVVAEPHPVQQAHHPRVGVEAGRGEACRERKRLAKFAYQTHTPTARPLVAGHGARREGSLRGTGAIEA